MPVLALVGVIVAVIVWIKVGPVWGALVGFLLVGGLGWRLLSAMPVLINPGARRFVRAWEERMGPMERRRFDSLPPDGLYYEWRASRAQYPAAADFLTAYTGRSAMPSADCRMAEFPAIAELHGSGMHLKWANGSHREAIDVLWVWITKVTLVEGDLQVFVTQQLRPMEYLTLHNFRVWDANQWIDELRRHHVDVGPPMATDQ